MLIVHLRRRELDSRILSLLKERPSLTNAEIRDFSGYSRQQVLGVEKKLEEEGLIELKGHGRGAHIVLVQGSET